MTFFLALSVTIVAAFVTYLSLVSFLVISACFVLYHCITFRRARKWKRSNIPFLRPTFLLGHQYFLSVFTQSLVVPLDRIYRECVHESVVAFFMTSIPMILIRDPKLILRIYGKSFDKAYQTGILPPHDDISTMNTINFCSDKDVWKFGRSAMAPVFLPTRMGGAQFEKFLKQVNRLWQYVEATRLKGEPIVARKVARSFVVDSVSLWNFGEDCNSYEETGKLEGLLNTYYEPKSRRLIGFWVQTHAPCLQVFERFRFTSRRSRIEMANFLRQEMEYRDAHNIDNGDFVDYLRSLNARDNTRDQNGMKEVTMDEMVGFSYALLVAGTDTAVALSLFAMHLLSLHPEHQQRIRREINEVMEKHNVTEFTYQVVHDLRYTEQCILETSRLYPIFAAIMRTCSEDFLVPDSKYHLRKGDQLVIIPYSIHRDPKYFKDPDKFDPERFSPKNKGLIPPETFLSFGIGPRKCPGKKIGLMTVTTLIAALLYKYELKPFSHFRQLEALDFDPYEFTIQYGARDILIHLSPRTNLTQ